jgi:4-hydroxy-tetrahydrodipicolinate synthase
VKHGTTMAGVNTGGVMPPLKPLNKDDKRELDQVIRVLKSTIADIQKG